MNSERKPDRTDPPRWAEALLQLSLAARERENVAGDLLEEYRESIVPARGGTASLWYIRQVSWYLLRPALLPSAAISATLVVRNLFDTFAPVVYTPGVIHPRSAVMSWTLMLVFAFAAGRAVWRTGRMPAGLLVALVSAILGGILSAAGAAAMLAIWHDPATLRAWQTSGGLEEALWGVPLLLVPIGLFTGAAGAVLSRLLRGALLPAQMTR